MQILNNIPDEAKVATAIAPTSLTLFNIPIDQWMYVMSAIVSIMFIIEKTPMLINRVRQFICFIKGKKKCIPPTDG